MRSDNFLSHIYRVRFLASNYPVVIPDGGAQSIATIPLDDFTRNGATVVIGMFAQWGLTQSLISLMWLFILIEWTGRLLLGFAKPFETVGQAPGGIGNMVFPALALSILVLSLKRIE